MHKRNDNPIVPLRARIVSLAKGGFGVASLVSDRTVNGPSKKGHGALLVPHTVPGDVVDIALEDSVKARLVRIVDPSIHRVTPSCPFVDACGGCDWMHIDLQVQRSARAAIVQDELGRVGVPAPGIESNVSGQVLQYRAKARVAVVAKQRGILSGFRAMGSHRIVPVETCLVLAPVLDHMRVELTSWLEGSVGVGEASIYKSRGGLPAVHLAWNGSLSSRVFAFAQKQIEQGRWGGACVFLDGASAPAVLGNPTGATEGVDGIDLFFPPGGFIQANETMNRSLVQYVDTLSGIDGKPTLELFAGSGNFTIALAGRTSELEAVEQNALAVDAARGNLERRGLKARMRLGDASGSDFCVRNAVRTVVLDPPRAGARVAVERIVESRVRKVVMVSCDPATFSRDVSILYHRGRFEIERLAVFEMFPCTSHVETVALLRRDR